ncbi:MAG: DUF1844 domain-containing protein [Candidatus Brocadiia bacterium]
MDDAGSKNGASRYVEPSDDLGKPTLSGFLNGLAAETMIHLGYFENPMSGERSLNLPLARFTIDLIEMLSEKTRGSQTAEESQLFEAILYTLRMRYLDAEKANPKTDNQP